MTREQWLNAVTRRLRPSFKEAGFPLPERVRMSCGFPSRGALGKVVGQCWSDSASHDGTFEIFISPRVSTAVEVVPILVHELCHAAVGLEARHGARFRAAHRAMGLVGKATQCQPGPDLLRRCEELEAKVGPYPHTTLDGSLTSGPKAQKGRMIKVACPECGFQVYMTRKWLDDVGTPWCPEHGAMEVA